MEIITKLTDWLRSARKSPKVYFCNNDLQVHSLQGQRAIDLRYGCFSCKNPSRYADLPKEIREQIPIDDLSRLRDAPVLCGEHVLGIKAVCSQCPLTIDEDGDTPPVGIWGFSSAGKTVFCAALLIEIQRWLNNWTGIAKHFLFNRNDYEEQVVKPLVSRGRVPEKTREEEHRRLCVKLSRSGWFRWKITLNDMAGDTFRLGFYQESLAENRAEGPNPMLEHMFRAREAIFLVAPEAFSGFGVSAQPDNFAAVNQVFEAMDSHGRLASLGQDKMKVLQSRVEETLTTFKFPIPGWGDSPYLKLAQALSALVPGGREDALVGRLVRGLTTVAVQEKVLDIEHQLDGLITFLDAEGRVPKVNGKLDLRIAITVCKSDLLPDKPHGYDEILAGLNATNSKKEFQAAIQRVSAASRKFLIEHNEGQFIKKAEENFRDVGFFFISSLGRETENYLEFEQDEVASSVRATTGGPMTQFGHQSMAAQASETQQPSPRRQGGWKLWKRVRMGVGGTRQPDPQHVLLPLLWILTAKK